MKTHLVILALAVLLLGASIYVFATQHAASAPSTEPPVRATLIFLDLTDALSDAQTAVLRSLLSQVIEQLSLGEQLSVYVLSGQAQSPRRIFQVTSPGRARDANPLTEGSQYLEDRFREEVLVPVDSILTTLSKADTSRTSPILEGFWQVTTYSDFARVTGPRRLVAVSDFIQNTAGFSFYRQADRTLFNRDGDLRDAAWEAKLSGVTFQGFVLLRPRDSRIQTPAFFQEWTRWSEQCGGTPIFTVVAS
jgi:hypothetical protein